MSNRRFQLSTALRGGTDLTQAETNVRAAQPSTRPEELLEAIAREEARLAQLEAEQAEGRTRLAAFRVELAAVGAEEEIRVRPPFAAEGPVPKTPAAKLKLFRSLFRGHEDVFPTRFVSKKTGKPGYAPAPPTESGFTGARPRLSGSTRARPR